MTETPIKIPKWLSARVYNLNLVPDAGSYDEMRHYSAEDIVWLLNQISDEDEIREYVVDKLDRDQFDKPYTAIGCNKAKYYIAKYLDNLTGSHNQKLFDAVMPQIALIPPRSSTAVLWGTRALYGNNTTKN